jgi:hypothetical protein
MVITTADESHMIWSNHIYTKIVTCMGVHVMSNNGSRSDDWIYWRFFTITLNYKPYSTLADLHTSQFIAAHALGFSVSTSRCLVADLNTGTITSNHYEVFLSFLLQSPGMPTQFSNSNSPVLN